MNKYIAILRGINVSGQKKVLMADLKALFETLNFTDVSTYIQSGNVIFQSAETNKCRLITLIENAIKQKYEFNVPVQIRCHSDLADIITELPFKEVNVADDGAKILITLLAALPSENNIEKLLGYVVAPEELHIIRQTTYLHCPNGYGRSKLSNVFIENKLKVSATTRNLKTVDKLLQLSRTHDQVNK